MPVEEAVLVRELREPFADLLSLVEKRPSMRVLDMSSGPAELTHEMQKLLAAREMIRFREEPLTARGNRICKRSGTGDDRTGAERYDLIVSTAPLQLISDHRSALRTLTECLREGGQLALQMPANGDHPANTIAAQVARQFGLEPRPMNVLWLDAYAELLFSLGFKRQQVRLQVYGRLLQSPAELVECVRDTILAPYESSLAPATVEHFLRAYGDELHDSIPPSSPYFFADKRLLIWASL